jgi:hypothetical protein
MFRDHRSITVLTAISWVSFAVLFVLLVMGAIADYRRFGMILDLLARCK